jgi:cytochrome c5
MAALTSVVVVAASTQPAVVGGQPPAAASAQNPPAAPAQPPRDGEQILNVSCSSCHDLAVIQTAAKSEAEWTQTLDQMARLGATVADADRPVLLQYLVRSHGPMPDGPGKAIVLNTCTICHDLMRVKRSSHTEEEWEGILIGMLNEGAPLSDADFPVVLDYLTKNFGFE